MTKIPLKLKEDQLTSINIENDQNTPTTQKMAETPPKQENN